MANCLPAFLGGVIIGFLMVCGGTLAQEGIPAGASSAVKFLKEAREIVYQSKQSSSTLSDQVIVGGYESLFITSMSRQSVFEKVEGVIHTFSTFVKHLTMSSELRETAESMMFSLQHHGSKFDCLKHYDIAFASPREGGKLELAYFDFLKQENGDWAVNQFKTSATFKQMPNYIIKTEQKSKKTFFSSKSSIEQTIVYVDPGANVDDIKALMFMTMPPSLLLPGVLPEGALSHK